jgi:hypothetical protein
MVELSERQETHEMARRFLTLQHALEHPALETAVRAKRKAWRDRQANRLGRFKTRPLAATLLSENDRALLSEALEVDAANDPEPLKQTVLLNKFRTGDLPFFYLDALKNAVPGSKSDWQQTTMVAVLEAIRNDKSQAVLIDARQLAQACEQITEPATATANKPFAGTQSNAKDIAKVLVAMGMLDMGWKKAEPKLIEAGVSAKRATFYRARKRGRKDRLRSSQP